MRLRGDMKGEDLRCLEELYMTAFPEIERKPLGLLLDKADEGLMELLNIEEDDGAFLGLAIMIYHRDLVLLDYFAIAKENRGAGIGSEALQLLMKRYRDKRFFLEIETPSEDAPNAKQRERRKEFYIRNGMVQLDYEVDCFGTNMLILTNGSRLTYEEYYEVYVSTFGDWARDKIGFVRDL